MYIGIYNFPDSFMGDYVFFIFVYVIISIVYVVPKFDAVKVEQKNNINKSS